MARPRPKNYKSKFLAYADSGSPYPSWDAFVEANRKKKCANPACISKRHNRGKYCGNCARFGHAFGDARYRPVRPEHYESQLKIVEDVVKFNKDNIIVTDHCEKWETLASQGKQGLDIEWSPWWAGIHGILNHRSYLHRKDAREYLCHFVAVYLLYYETGNEVIKNDKLWHYALADIALRKCKSRVIPKANPKRMIKFGKVLWSYFSLSWIRIARAVQENELEKKIRKKQLAEAELKLPAKGVI